MDKPFNFIACKQKELPLLPANRCYVAIEWILLK